MINKCPGQDDRNLKVETIRTNIEKRWLRTEFKTFKKSPPKLNIFYILDGKGPFEPKNLGEINEFIEVREYPFNLKLRINFSVSRLVLSKYLKLLPGVLPTSFIRPSFR